MKQPKFAIPGATIEAVIFDADFEQTASEMPSGSKICLPDPNQFRACTMRGHDGGYHSEDRHNARRHNAFHDLDTPKWVDKTGVLVDMYGREGKFVDHQGCVFDPRHYEYMLKTAYIDKQKGALIQRGFVGNRHQRAWNYNKPNPPRSGSPEIHTSWLQTIARIHDPNRGGNIVLPAGELWQENMSDRSQLLYGPRNGVFRQNTLFEMQVNFSRMSTGGHRHSWWFMPVEPNTAYDSIARNGCEPDAYEHEVTRNADFSKKCFMKCLAGSHLGNTINEIPNPGQEWGWENGAIGFDDINADEWQTFTLLWETDKLGNGHMRWFRNGVEVVRDSRLSPIDVAMYMILSREANVDHGLSGENIYDYLDQIAEDYVMTRYIRAWKVTQKDDLNAPRVSDDVDYSLIPPGVVTPPGLDKDQDTVKLPVESPRDPNAALIHSIDNLTRAVDNLANGTRVIPVDSLPS